VADPPGVAMVVVLARAPSAAGKTRLTATMTSAQGQALRQALLEDTLASANATGFPVTLCYTPAHARDEMAALAGRAGGVAPVLHPQRDGDLGARMRHAIGTCLDDGSDRVVLIGSDLPGLPADHLTSAVAALASPADVVLGPSEDGGYYLVGVSRTRSAAALEALFEGVPWGTPEVLATTLAKVRAAGLCVALVAPWFDVDSPEDLARVCSDETPESAPRTRAWAAGSPGSARLPPAE
jgi:rSAM/selenodomain-associated transferase 1